MFAHSPLTKNRIRHAFSNAVMSYDTMASLQRTVGKDLLKNTSIGQIRGTVLDIGCGTGFLTAELQALLNCHQLIALDLALPMVEVTRKKHKAMTHVTYLCADTEALPLVDHSVDAVFSNVALQWCQNLSRVLGEIKRVLKPTGSLVFSTFGHQTLRELKAAWASVDHFNHVNEFYNAQQIYSYLETLGYHSIVITEKIHTPHYESVITLMRELKGLGAHHVIAGRHHQMTRKASFQKMIHHYEWLRGDQGIPATFEIFEISAKISP